MTTPEGKASDDARPDDGPPNFVREIIAADQAAGKNEGRVVTRFPPEPNGYLHLGHAKAICLDFGMAAEFGGHCNLRFDDTNPEKEDVEYVDSIKADVRWLGFEWGEHEYFASDYYQQLYEWALVLIEDGKAYVDSQSPDEIKENRGNFYKPGKDSPHRNRSVEENLELFEKMRAGEIDEGAAVLRAKIDMQSKNLNMRDPLIYRVKKVTHHRTGDDWCIYPMYDYAHGLSDAIEGVTHSLCTLEFQDHRPLYDWFIEQLPVPHVPRQIEFARLNVGFMIMSKRKLLMLVRDGHVEGWDDPRMPTLSGLRRRGITPEAIRRFCDRVGVAKRDGVVDVSLFEFEIREHLNQTSPRAMAVLDPIKLVITNYPEGESEEFEARNHPDDDAAGTRKVPFSRELWVERDDFREEAPRKWHRLAPGKEVRLRYACLVTCNEVVKDASGEVVELRCTWDPESRGGTSPDGRKVRGTIHWVSATHAVDARVRLYDRLFTEENPGGHEDRPFTDFLNPDSLKMVDGAKLEPSLARVEPGHRVQFERLGYFCADSQSKTEAPVFNRTIALRDSWAKIEKKLAKGG
jgi:glutaminyl-tRNA synthetase